MKIDIDGPYREKRGLAQELRAYIMIAKIIAITAILLIGIHAINQLDEVMSQQRIHDKTMADCMDQIMWLRMEVDEIKEADKPEIDPPKQVSLGEYEIFHYCLENYPHICNNGDSTCTSSGQVPIPHYTVAADKSIPFGTILVIDGAEYEVMDRGGNINGNRLDVAVETHKEAINRGRVIREVFKTE